MIHWIMVNILIKNIDKEQLIRWTQIAWNTILLLVQDIGNNWQFAFYCPINFSITVDEKIQHALNEKTPLSLIQN